MSITMENRPVKAGVYQQITQLNNSTTTLQQAQAMIQKMQGKNAITQDGRGIIGLWRWTQPERPGRLRYNTLPPKTELFDVYSPEFVPGSALAFVPTGQPYVSAIYNSFALLENIQTPPGWIPKETILDANGRPIRETSADGKTINLTQTDQQTAPTSPALYEPPDISGVGQMSLLGDLDDDGDEYGDEYGDHKLGIIQPILSDQEPSMQTIPAVAPAVAAIAPILIKGALWIGGLTLTYFAVRDLLRFVWKIVYSGYKTLAQPIVGMIRAGAEKLQKAGLLLPVAFGAAVAAAIALSD